jgi:hypothetical protein
LDVAFALLLPLIAGYLYVSACDQLKFKQSRDEGHRLYFRIAYFGLLCFLLSAILIGLADFFFGKNEVFADIKLASIALARPLLKTPESAAAQVGFVAACIGAVMMGRFLPHADNFFFKSKAEQAALDAAQQDDLEMLLLEAAVQYKSISVTTSSNKVYVGLVLQTGEPKTNRRVIALLPLMSGYRGETGKVTFTTFYDEIYQERAESRDDEETNDFRLILPMDKIASVSFFDVNVYASFNEKGKPPPRRRVKVPSRLMISPRSRKPGEQGGEH